MKELIHWSGLVIGLGFILYAAAMVAAPQVYQEKDIAIRVNILDRNPGRWLLSQWLFALGIASPAAGFLLMAIAQRSGTLGWLTILGATLFALGAVIGVWLVYVQTRDPAAFWAGTATAQWIGFGYLGLTLSGAICLGIALQSSGVPAWAGYLLAGSAGLLLVAALAGKGKLGFFVSVVFYLVTLVVGYAIWQS